MPISSKVTLKSALDITATCAVIGVAAIFAWQNLGPRTASPAPKRAPLVLPSEPLSLDGMAVKGSSSAKVAVVEFSDFECPFCGTFATDTLPELSKAYIETGKVLFAFRHLPLTGIHENAFQAAEAANCAGLQGKFWQMHDIMYEQQKRLQEPHLLLAFKTLGGDDAQFAECLAKQTTKTGIRESVRQARTIKIATTPTFLIGIVQPDGRVMAKTALSGLQSIEALQEAIDPLLNGKR